MINRFGTTSEMIIQDVEENGVAWLLAIDGKGLYLTTRNRVDTRLADPNRYSDRRHTAQRLSALGMSPDDLFSQNQHLIKVESGGGAKKVNPLKASKRGMKSA